MSYGARGISKAWQGLLGALLLGAVLTAAGCTHHHERWVVQAPTARKQGPPPHAPAHGYRYKHAQHGVELVFDAKLRVYVVAGHLNHYFHDGHYYRQRDGTWQVSVDLRRGWKRLAASALPAGLRADQPGKRGRKAVPAKHAH